MKGYFHFFMRLKVASGDARLCSLKLFEFPLVGLVNSKADEA